MIQAFRLQANFNEFGDALQITFFICRTWSAIYMVHGKEKFKCGAL
jgi:hypothetical protein